jgi:hypothetical protein
VVCETVHGPAPTAKHEAAHSCGNGHLGCVSPHHLSWKTPIENAADKLNHGTNPNGENNGQSKLTAENVSSIRQLAGILAQRKIAERFGVSQSAVSLIVSGRNWRHSE